MKKHSENFQEDHIDDISKAMGCLTFYKIIDKFPKYKYYFENERWNELIEIFKRDSFYILGITHQSGLEITLQVMNSLYSIHIISLLFDSLGYVL